MNTAKTGALFLVLTFLLLVTGALIGAGDPSIILVFLLIALVMNFFGFWYGDKLVLSMSKAKQVTPEEAHDLHRIVDEQVYLAGLPKPKVFVIDSDSPNAFATGRSKKHASIAVTQGITRILDRDELGAVLAHELAHVGNRDTLIMTMVAAVAGAISMIAWMAQWSLIFGGMSGRRNGGGGSPIALIGLLVVIIVMPMVALLVRLAISRTREYQADKTGALTSGKPLALANALRKLQRGAEVRPMEIPKERLESVSHLFIVNPLKGDGMVKLFSTHPPVEERIRRLESLEARSLWPGR